eukprot:2668107-Prymnesium_polylepis.1
MLLDEREQRPALLEHATGEPADSFFADALSRFRPAASGSAPELKVPLRSLQLQRSKQAPPPHRQAQHGQYARPTSAPQRPGPVADKDELLHYQLLRGAQK